MISVAASLLWSLFFDPNNRDLHRVDTKTRFLRKRYQQYPARPIRDIVWNRMGGALPGSNDQKGINANSGNH